MGPIRDTLGALLWQSSVTESEHTVGKSQRDGGESVVPGNGCAARWKRLGHYQDSFLSPHRLPLLTLPTLSRCCTSFLAGTRRQDAPPVDVTSRPSTHVERLRGAAKRNEIEDDLRVCTEANDSFHALPASSSLHARRLTFPWLVRIRERDYGTLPSGSFHLTRVGAIFRMAIGDACGTSLRVFSISFLIFPHRTRAWVKTRLTRHASLG